MNNETLPDTADAENSPKETQNPPPPNTKKSSRLTRDDIHFVDVTDIPPDAGFILLGPTRKSPKPKENPTPTEPEKD